jgi:lytic murein transglycosylase
MRTLSLLAPLLLAAALPAAADPVFTACLDGLRPQAGAAGIRTDTFDRLTAGLAPDPTVLESLDFQPEFRTPIWDYLAGLVDEERVDDGRAMLAEHAALLKRVQAQYGVDPETVVAVWGVESNYGRTFGKKPLLASLATLSCAGRRQAFFRSEFFATLRLIQAGDLRPEGLVGSWAGAFGHTQFMPSTYARIAVDFDGDGRRDLVGSIPDALASTANYLKRSGWRTGQAWGREVVLPAGFDASVNGRQARRPLSAWLARGVKSADGSPLSASDDATALLLPAGPKGPAFLVHRNFDAIYSYNAAESYALAIAHLSDRLRGRGPLVAAWPTDDPGLSRRERRELQELLVARGHDIGEVDGMIGSRSREALKLEQARLGQPADGRAGQRILQALREPSPQP